MFEASKKYRKSTIKRVLQKIATNQKSKICLFYIISEQDPLYLDRYIKEELIDDEWNETPYFQNYNYSEIDNTVDYAGEVDLMLEEKYRIPIISTKQKTKTSYRHLIRLYCQRCRSNSLQEGDYSKTFTCENKNCREPLSFQCITCENCYKHLASAYRHVRYTCKGFKNVIKTEIKTEYDSQSSNAKVYNPYGRKNNQRITNAKKKKKPLECSKCYRVYKNIKTLQNHTKLCGAEPNFNCEFCSFKSKYRWSVKQHVENMHIKKEKLYQIGLSVAKSKAKCVYRVKKRKRVKRLNKTGNSKTFCCAHCNYKIYRKDHLVIHLQRNHSEVYPLNLFTCKLCNKDCRDVYNFNSHMKNKCNRRNARVILNDIKM